MYMIIEDVGKLVDQWQREAESLRDRHGAEAAAQTTSSLAAELRSHLDGLRYKALEIDEAAKLSGYSKSTLRRHVRDGTIPNAGEEYAPRIRLIDLPRKAGHLHSREKSRDVAGARSQVVRSVASQS